MLWAVVAALAATTLALGAALVQVSRQRAEEVAPATPLTPVATVASVLEPEMAAIEQEKTAVAPVESAPIAPKKVAKTQIASAKNKAHSTVAAKSAGSEPWEVVETAPTSAGVATPAAQKAVCAVCGTVESVTPVEHEAKPSGAGAVAGAVLGGLVGNQFGGGDGKTLATIAGIVGGGLAGNTVEKRMKKELLYRVEVRMEDGSVRTIEQTSPATVGTRVKVEGGSISPAAQADPA